MVTTLMFDLKASTQKIFLRRAPADQETALENARKVAAPGRIIRMNHSTRLGLSRGDVEFGDFRASVVSAPERVQLVHAVAEALASGTVSDIASDTATV